MLWLKITAITQTITPIQPTQRMNAVLHPKTAPTKMHRAKTAEPELLRIRTARAANTVIRLPILTDGVRPSFGEGWYIWISNHSTSFTVTKPFQKKRLFPVNHIQKGSPDVK